MRTKPSSVIGQVAIFLRAAGKPCARFAIHAVHGIKERNQNIDVKQRYHSSSRSAFTDSKVALPAPGWIGMNAKPVLSGLGVTGSNALRSNSLTNCPAVLRCLCAASLIDSKTSASTSKVVRIITLQVINIKYYIISKFDAALKKAANKRRSALGLMDRKVHQSGRIFCCDAFAVRHIL